MSIILCQLPGSDGPHSGRMHRPRRGSHQNETTFENGYPLVVPTHPTGLSRILLWRIAWPMSYIFVPYQCQTEVGTATTGMPMRNNSSRVHASFTRRKESPATEDDEGLPPFIHPSISSALRTSTSSSAITPRTTPRLSMNPFTATRSIRFVVAR